ncbi:SUMF1/EgtB/PvdO family nonheme iron enzyme [Uliginosibacterium sp. TH139]|uniref:formylglycine-generating enzyme family protein n=1 Tax=Uliginosibacterium sp. TH139 TaxID=2067453 RepID=UPI000C7E2709|nr:SUMF1/EgtB/PvdO family nonheme iron enzyme [Uliginosibacterium sp. TH139]PLK47317.1 sulfatase [Uliginosibacterium sp. TH139]
MRASKTFAWFALAIFFSSCEASTPAPAKSASAPSPQSPALQALVAKTKKNLVFVEGGTFQMGDFGMVHNAAKLPYYGALDTMPLHEVTLDRFSIAAYKTTYEDYDVYTEATGQKKIAQDPRDIYYKRRTAPARTHWQAARNYCQWLGKQVGTLMDLPTEAQWEYAARNRGQMVVYATDNGKIEAGRNVPTYEWLEEHNKEGSASSLYEVGLFPPSPLGLYDLVSNGADWTLDWYDAKYYANSPILNPKGPKTGTEKVTRGQENLEPVAMEMRAMTMVRLPIDPTGRFADYAMRCVANSAQKIQ